MKSKMKSKMKSNTTFFLAYIKTQSMSVNKVWNFKPLISALFAFTAILVVQNYTSTSPMNLSEYKGFAVIFLAIMVSQVLFEIVYKYEGKTCELMDGLFTSLFAILGYFIGVTFGGFITKVIPNELYSTLQTNPINLTGAVFATFFLWIWKQWIRNKILPSECAPCNK